LISNTVPYWTATTDHEDAAQAYAVGIGPGTAFPYPKTQTYAVLCVRGGAGQRARQ
jgi:hypothetical protein